MTMKRRPFIDRHAPILDPTRYRRAIIKDALENYILSDTVSPREKSAARSLLREIHRIEQARPATTFCGMLKLGGGSTSVWVYEKELAPAGSCPQAVLAHNAALERAVRAIRA